MKDRPCTCHPDERPAICQRRYALSECQAADRIEAARLSDEGAEPVAWIGKNPRTYDVVVTAHKPPPSVERDFGFRPLFTRPAPPAQEPCVTDEMVEAAKFYQSFAVTIEEDIIRKMLAAALTRTPQREALAELTAEAEKLGMYEGAEPCAWRYIDDDQWHDFSTPPGTGERVHLAYLRPTTQPSAAQDERARLYEELLYAVETKFLGETRHQTALREVDDKALHELHRVETKHDVLLDDYAKLREVARRVAGEIRKMAERGWIDEALADELESAAGGEG